jgi:hypothetical protein
MRGRRLSVVQEIGLELLQRQDTLDKGERFVSDFRLAQIAAGASPAEVFPEYFPGEAADLEAEDSLAQDGVEYDYSGVRWQSPSDIADDELALLAQMMGQDEISVSGADGERPVPGEWV